MARPSVAQVRREQIIEATLKTIATHGVRDTTLDRIADAVGMSRGHVRHFVGNRDNLLRDAAWAFFTETNQRPAILSSDLTTLDEAIEYLFGEYFQTSDENNAIVLALVDFSRTSPEIAEILAEAYSQAGQRLSELVAAAYPNLDEATQEGLAGTILTTALGNVFLGDFDANPARITLIRRSIEHLLHAAGARNR